jgi:hypothetical protein
LAPGASSSIHITVEIRNSTSGGMLQNCAALNRPGLFPAPASGQNGGPALANPGIAPPPGLAGGQNAGPALANPGVVPPQGLSDALGSRSCKSVVLPGKHLDPVCAPGLIPRPDGCKCPDGTSPSDSNGVCPPRPPTVNRCPDGSIATAAGCNQGACKLGQRRNSDGNCVGRTCKDGFELDSDGDCVKVSKVPPVRRRPSGGDPGGPTPTPSCNLRQQETGQCGPSPRPPPPQIEIEIGPGFGFPGGGFPGRMRPPGGGGGVPYGPNPGSGGFPNRSKG